MHAAYMTVSAGLISYWPLVSIGFAILIFGFLSWFHFYKPKTGAILLTLALIGMYLSWPVLLMIEYFSESAYNPSPVEFLTPLVLGGLLIFLVWKSKNTKLNKWINLALAVPPALFGLYVGGYMLIRMFGLN